MRRHRAAKKVQQQQNLASTSVDYPGYEQLGSVMSNTAMQGLRAAEKAQQQNPTFIFLDSQRSEQLDSLDSGMSNNAMMEQRAAMKTQQQQSPTFVFLDCQESEQLDSLRSGMSNNAMQTPRAAEKAQQHQNPTFVFLDCQGFEQPGSSTSNYGYLISDPIGKECLPVSE